MGDNDFPAAMANQPIGYRQQYVTGDTQYAQKGDGIPDFATRANYSQQEGGPLVAKISLGDRIKNFLGNFNDLDAARQEEASNQKIKDMAADRYRQRQINELNERLRKERGYGGM